MARKQDWVLGGIFLAAFIIILMVFLFSFGNVPGSNITTISSGGDKIALVELRGVIYDSRDLVRQFKRYGEDRSIKAIVFRVDSPGGGVAASQEIYEQIRKVRESGKPVVVSMGSVAASGGYYVSCGADSIVANPGTTTGSIGVILETTDVAGLLKKLGVEVNVVKSGKFKDTGSPFRKMTKEEKAYLQKYIDNAYHQFVNVVSKERHIPEDKVLKIADGRIFTGEQALKLGLVDKLGTYEDAIQLAAKMAGIRGKPSLVKMQKRKRTVFDLLFSDVQGILGKIQSAPMLRYQLELNL
ncbi:MAG: signal peptide peptidase SppA [Calditrichaeota bacterium]|nr:signal peptide peptidase SppA [Calditrichota bacterium]